jgi:hypothetical protein
MTHDNICLPKNYILVILCVLIGVSTLYIYNQKNNDSILDKIYKSTQNPIITHKSNTHNNITLQTELNTKNNDILINQNDLLLNQGENIRKLEEKSLYDIRKRVLLEERDRNVLDDNFKPPERRLPFHAYPENIKHLINIPSRGYPDNYQLMGLVIRDNTETAYNLFGRQTYPGSEQYEYYVQKTGINDNVKIPIQIKGNKEIEDEQEINILGTNKEKGSFKIKLYDYNSPRYNPYII